MSTLKRQEPVGAGLRRTACEAVEAGVRALTRQADRTAAAADAIREAAAVLALLGPALPRAAVRRDRALIDRLQAGLEELDHPAVLLDRLNRRFPKPPADADTAAAAKALRKQWSVQSRNHKALNSRGGSFNPAIYRLVADMAELRGHIGDWPTDAIDDAPPPGLRRTYTRARRLATPPADPAALPELVACIDLLHAQLDLFSKTCPPMVKAQRKLLSRAHESLSTLQADQALDRMLREQTKRSAKPGAAALAKQLETVLADDVRIALAETPSAFTNRIGVYWSAWRSDPSS